MRFIIGFLVGVAATVGFARLIDTGNGGTTILTTQRDLQFERGILIPSGVELIRESTLNVNLCAARLYLNIDEKTCSEALTRRQDEREHLRIAYGESKNGITND